MTGIQKVAISAIAILGLCAMLVATIILVRNHQKGRPLTLSGAVVKQDKDPRKQYPVANVEVKSPGGLLVRDGKSDFSGSFRIIFLPGVNLGQPVQLSSRHPNFQPFDIKENLPDKL